MLSAACFLGACADGSRSPPAHPEASLERLASEAGNLAPLDLVYVCGNKFLATNSTKATVHLTYRVLGTGETGGVTLPPGPLEDPGHSETELETKGLTCTFTDRSTDGDSDKARGPPRPRRTTIPALKSICCPSGVRNRQTLDS